MSTFNPNAPAFIPTFLRNALTNAVGGGGNVNGEKERVRETTSTTPSPAHPRVFLLFGCRGAGKTTQSELLAKEYNLLNLSSGNMYKEGKQPFVELRRILLEVFGEGKERRYSGAVLDRFVVNSEFDAFYIQSVLDSVKLPVPFVFMLAIDPALASKRAESRADNKVAHMHWRVVEQKAQAVTANTVYGPIGCLKTIHIHEEDSVEDIFREMKSCIQSSEVPANPESVKLPSASRGEARGMKLIEDYETYMKIVVDVHAAVGNISGRKDSAPLSTIGAYLDREYFSFTRKNLRSLLSTFHVTPKADGQRYLLVKHKNYGFIGFPSAFTHCYDLNSLFNGVDITYQFSPQTQKLIAHKKRADDDGNNGDGGDIGPVEILFDTELIVHGDDHKATFYVFDYLYFNGLEGKKMRFETRLKILREFFAHLSSAADVIRLKDYVPINMLRTLIPKLKETHMPMDGLVFQHSDVYKIGRDKFLVKWKPIEQCTVDFRLTNGVFKKEDNSWTFDLMATDDVSENGGFGEIPFEGAFAVIESTVVNENHLCNGIIVELALEERIEKTGDRGQQSQTAATRWSFRAVRNDKPSPNKYSIVKKIVELKHLSLEELVDLCDKVPFYANS